MSLAVLANHMASKGRHGDDMLVHMSKDEVAALQKMAEQHGMTLTINPETGLPEAFSLKQLLGVVAPIALNFFAPGLGSAIGGAFGLSGAAASAVGGALLSGGISALATGSLEKGLMTGLMSYGLSGLGEAAKTAGEAAKQVPVSQAAEAAAIASPTDIAAATQAPVTPPPQYAPTPAAQAELAGTAPVSAPPTVNPQDAFARSEILARNAASQAYSDLSPFGKMQAAFQGDPNFLKNNWKNLAMVGLPALSLMSSQPSLKGVGEQDPSLIRFPRFRVDATGRAYQEPGFTLADYRKAVMEGRNPLTYAADGGIVALADGGVAMTPSYQRTSMSPGMLDFADRSEPVVRMADGGEALTGQAYTDAMANINDLLAQAATEQQARNAAAAAPAVAASAVDPYAGLTPLTASSSVQNIADLYNQTVGKGTATEGQFVDYARAQGVGIPSLMEARDVLTPGTARTATSAGDYLTAGATPQDLANLYRTTVGAGTITEADLVKYAQAKGIGTPALVRAAELVGSPDRYLTTRPDLMAESALINQVKGAYANMVTNNPKTGLTTPQFIDLAREHRISDDILRKAGLLPPLRITTITGGTGNDVLQPPTYGEAPIASVIPGAGPVPTMNEVVNAYTQGGGSTGYIPYFPKSVAELEARYPLSGASADAYNYLMGRPGAKYPVAQKVPGGIMKSYWDTVGQPAPVYTAKTLAPKEDTTSTVGPPTGSYQGLMASDKTALQNALRDAQSSKDYAPLNALLKAYKLTKADLMAAFPGLTEKDIAAYKDKLSFYEPPPQPYSYEGGGGDSGGSPGKAGGLMSLARGGLGELRDSDVESAYDKAVKRQDVPRANKLKNEIDYRQRMRSFSINEAPSGLEQFKNPVAQYNAMAHGGMPPAVLAAAAAKGGISHLGDYSDGGRLLKGPGDGVSDSIPATIANKRPARLADGEFVVPARIVSELGNGSTDAGARKLYAMMDRIQANRSKTTGKGKVAVNSRADKYLPA